MSPRKTTPTLFPSDLAYLQSEHRWLELRSRRLATERTLRDRAEGSAKRSRRFYGDDDDGEQPSSALRRRLSTLKRQEAGAREEIDARLAEQLRQDRPLAIQRLVELYELGEFERLGAAAGHRAGSGPTLREHPGAIRRAVAGVGSPSTPPSSSPSWS